MPTRQLALEGIALRAPSTLSSFYPLGNEAALSNVKMLATGNGERFVYLWGASGVGCTHLLQGACHFASSLDRGAIYLSLAKPNLSVSIVEGLEQLNIVCLDDIQAIAGNKEWEEGLFHLFNKLRDRNHSLLVAANCSPKYLSLNLADLKSRLSSGVTFHLKPLDDDALLLALKLRAKQRGFILSDEVANFLIRRWVRSMAALHQVLDKLDQLSLQEKRKITIPFIKSALNI